MKLELIDYKELDDFPSGSGIEFFNDRIYIIGDDAKDILVTNKKWKKPYVLQLFEHAEKRVPKKEKADLEATTIIEVDKQPHLLIAGSGSKEKRNQTILLNLETEEVFYFDSVAFYNRLTTAGMATINIEGAATVGDRLVFVNRGHKKSPDNHLVVTTIDMIKKPDTASFQLYKVELPETKDVVGISGITYAPYNEMLLFTTSTEDTDNAYDDGSIGKSYLGIITNAYRKIGREKKMKITTLLDLAEADKKFKGCKIESVAVQSERDNSMKLHLVADNDNGKTYLFKVLFSF